MSRRTAQAARGAAFAAIATLLAAAAHALGGAGAPSPLFCVVVAAIAAPFAVLLAGPRVRAWRTWAAVAVSQVLFHVSFATMGDLGTFSPVAGEHAHHGLLGHAEASAALPVDLSAPMLLAHAAAAALTALVLRQGERTVVTIRRWALRIVLPTLHEPATRPAPRVPAPAPAPHVSRPRVTAEPAVRRGPPALSPAV